MKEKTLDICRHNNNCRPANNHFNCVHIKFKEQTQL